VDCSAFPVTGTSRFDVNEVLVDVYFLSFLHSYGVYQIGDV
jgi:hypothetical protein